MYCELIAIPFAQSVDHSKRNAYILKTKIDFYLPTSEFR